MTTESRDRLLRAIAELGREAPELRLGQLVANVATLARGAQVEAIWDADDDDLLTAAERLLARYRERKAGAA